MRNRELNNVELTDFGRWGNSKGAANEKNLVAIVKELATTEEFSWISYCRRGTVREDHQGIDVVVETKFGTMHLQSKSSKREASKFRSKNRGRLIEVVVMEKGKSKDRTKLALSRLKEATIKCKSSKIEYPLIEIKDLTPEEVESYFSKKEY